MRTHNNIPVLPESVQITYRFSYQLNDQPKPTEITLKIIYLGGTDCSSFPEVKRWNRWPVKLLDFPRSLNRVQLKDILLNYFESVIELSQEEFDNKIAEHTVEHLIMSFDQ